MVLGALGISLMVSSSVGTLSGSHFSGFSASGPDGRTNGGPLPRVDDRPHGRWPNAHVIVRMFQEEGSPPNNAGVAPS